MRHVSEGRLLRGSSYGRLLVERDRYFVGDTVVVRAHSARRVASRTRQECGAGYRPAPAGDGARE